MPSEKGSLNISEIVRKGEGRSSVGRGEDREWDEVKKVNVWRMRQVSNVVVSAALQSSVLHDYHMTCLMSNSGRLLVMEYGCHPSSPHNLITACYHQTAP